MAIVAIIVVVLVVFVVGYVMLSKSGSDEDKEAAEESGKDNPSTGLDAFAQKEADFAAKNYAMNLNLSFLNKGQETRFNNLMEKYGKACRGPGKLARKWTKRLDKKGYCYTKGQALAAAA